MPATWTRRLAERIGAAFARHVGAPAVAVGRDCRTSSPLLAAAFMSGVNSQGAGCGGPGTDTDRGPVLSLGRPALFPEPWSQPLTTRPVTTGSRCVTGGLPLSVGAPGSGG